jgi:deoxyribodipyrimidine photo-lyase
MPPSILWFRRDLRLSDNPALSAAVDEGSGTVVPLYVVDPTEWARLGGPQKAYLTASLDALRRQIGGLHVRHGNPIDVVPELAAKLGAGVHAAGDSVPYAVARDVAVAERCHLTLTGSAYAVSPGSVVKGDGTPYRVFTPFYAAWLEHGWRTPSESVAVDWLIPAGEEELPAIRIPAGLELPESGEAAAQERWRAYVAGDLAEYAATRDLPGVDRTSRMSAALAHGEIHPRTMLADLGPGDDAYRRELAFREFYADVLHHRPDSAFGYYNRSFEAMQYDEPGADFEAWKQGRTGIPIVDAGMRQLLAEGWIHNRVRMIVASFVVKDLHLEWQHGARHFLDLLVDADLASNQHGWQWIAGAGTDASPYFRIFNPTTQGKKFDPEGEYVRRWVPELADVAPKHIHTPWELDEPPAGYPPPLVDHAAERLESLRRYDEIRPR